MEKAIKKFDVKVNVQKIALRFRENIKNRCDVSSNSCSHPLLSYDNDPQ